MPKNQLNKEQMTWRLVIIGHQTTLNNQQNPYQKAIKGPNANAILFVST